MTFIPGDLLVARINETFNPRLIKQLARWYHKYHDVNGMIKGDPRLRNFICASEGVFGLDFEEARKGHWISDIGGVAASLLDTDPINDIRKRRLAWKLLEEYLSLVSESRSSETDRLFIQTVATTLKETYHWRSDERILSLSEQISNEGIPIE
jgi:hypothetical protein